MSEMLSYCHTGVKQRHLVLLALLLRKLPQQLEEAQPVPVEGPQTVLGKAGIT